MSLAALVLALALGAIAGARALLALAVAALLARLADGGGLHPDWSWLASTPALVALFALALAERVPDLGALARIPELLAAAEGGAAWRAYRGLVGLVRAALAGVLVLAFVPVEQAWAGWTLAALGGAAALAVHALTDAAAGAMQESLPGVPMLCGSLALDLLAALAVWAALSSAMFAWLVGMGACVLVALARVGGGDDGERAPVAPGAARERLLGGADAPRPGESSWQAFKRGQGGPPPPAAGP